jgi:voltage-gated potassium channel
MLLDAARCGALDSVAVHSTEEHRAPRGAPGRKVAGSARLWRAMRESPLAHRRLYYGRPSSAPRSVLRRLLLVVSLIAVVVAVFTLDRGGLRDNIDGEVSFADVVYFAMITITTVGYGDIVPVTTTARLVDAFFVTPVRLFVWAIFLGTAYQFVARRFIEEIRMRIRQLNLSDHIVICGFGHAGRSAAVEMVRRGHDPKCIVVVDQVEDVLFEAAELGAVGLRGDATRDAVLQDANVGEARAVFVCLGRDDTAVLATLTARGLAPDVRIVTMIKEAENESLARKGGAAATICPSVVSGILMANSIDTSHVARYVYDMLTIDGRVTLSERIATAADFGKRAAELPDGLALRIHRGERVIGFWEQDAVVAEGDRLLVLAPRTGR